MEYAKHRLGIKSHILLDVAPRQIWTRNFPISVNIVVGNQCNLRCGHCPYHGPTAPDYFSTQDVMAESVVKRLMCELPRHKTSAKFGQFEEPLLYPSFCRMAEYLLSNGVPVHLTTNGALLSPENMELVSRLSTLYVSIDATTEETYRAVRGRGLHKVVANVETLASHFQGGKMGVSFVQEKVNNHESREFLRYWFDKVDCVIFYALLGFTTDGARYDIAPYSKPFLDPPSHRVVCTSPFLETYVLPNGDVTLCCQSLLMTGRTEVPIMGNVTTESLASIWHRERYVQYREALIDEDWVVAKMCKSCFLWSASYHEITRERNKTTTRNPTTLVVEKR